MERYFVIFYSGNPKIGGQQLGFMTSVTKNGAFINANNLVEWLKEKNPDTITFVITGFIELSKEDFEQWIA